MNYFDGMVIERPDIKYDSIPQQDGPVGIQYDTNI